MDNYLLQYAIDNVWCNPGQDKQFAYKLRKLTPSYGVRGDYVVEYQRYYMPTNNNRDFYHIFQIGQVIPMNLGLPKIKDTWISLADLARKYQTLVTAYVNNGVRYAMTETYILITQAQNLLVAIRANDRYPSPDENDVYMHLYRNAYFDSKRCSDAGHKWIQLDTLVADSKDSIRQMQIAIIDTMKAKGGIPQYFVNGKMVDEISIVTAAGGDYCEFLLDPSIKKVIEFNIDELPVFHSNLDAVRKYILHYPGKQTPETIDFYDDIDLFLCQRGQRVGTYKGIYYHHNEGTWARQLTHRDYSVSTTRVSQMIVDSPDKWTGTANKFFRMYIRRAGYERPLVADAHRIQELYRLSDINIIRMMTGADATNPLWRAENLEKSIYVQFMSASPSFIYPITYNEPELNSEGKVEAQNFAAEVFGYHECAHLLNDNPALVKTEDGTNRHVAELAYNFWKDATIFEYNKEGILLGYYYHVGGRYYYPVDETCYMVEAITGRGSDNLQGYYGNVPVNLKGGYGWRVYVTQKWGGVPTNEWKDITDLPNRHEWGYFDETLGNEQWVWTCDPAKWYGYIRTDRYFYLKEIRYQDDPGLYRFALDNWENHNGDLVNRVMQIPLGQMDIFINNRPIIDGLDHFSAKQKTVINNLEYRKENEINTVLIRCTGFCDSNLKRYPPTEVGFVEYGVLSNDATYNIHTHKVQRIIVDGHYKDFKDVIFAEDNNEQRIPNERNGSPFQIQTPQVTFRSIFKDDIKARKEDDERDKLVSDSMSFYFPRKEPEFPDIAKMKYHVYSSFSNKILNDLLKGYLVVPFIKGRYTDADIKTALKDYEWLAEYDILNHEYNTNHVIVYPHWWADPVGLPMEEYNFYLRVIKLYLRQPLDTSPFVYITRT